jgi:hypothetical protein
MLGNPSRAIVLVDNWSITDQLHIQPHTQGPGSEENCFKLSSNFFFLFLLFLMFLIYIRGKVGQSSFVMCVFVCFHCNTSNAPFAQYQRLWKGQHSLVYHTNWVYSFHWSCCVRKDHNQGQWPLNHAWSQTFSANITYITWRQSVTVQNL